MARLKRVPNKKEFERTIDDHLVKGYKIQKKQETVAKLKLKDYGSLQMHILIGVLTFWWTVGIGNIVYALIRYLTASTVTIKVDEEVEGYTR